MGDSVSQTAEDAKTLPQSSGPVALASLESPHGDRNLRKGRQQTSSQQSISPPSYVPSQQYGSQYQALQARPDPFNLNQLSTALPDSSYQNYGQLPPRFPSASGSSGLVYPTQNNPQYAAPQALSPTNAPYSYQTPFQGAYVAGNPPPVAGLGNQFYHQGYMGRPQQHTSPYIIQPNQFPLHPPAFPGIQQPQQYGSRGSISEENRAALQQRSGRGQGGSDSFGKLMLHSHLQRVLLEFWYLTCLQNLPQVNLQLFEDRLESLVELVTSNPLA
jgi:hypothetical protein